MAEDKDLPAISLPNDSTQVDIKPVLKAQPRPNPPAGKMKPPTESLPAHKLVAKAPAKLAAAPPRRPATEAVKAQKPTPAAAPVRRPATEAVKAQKPTPAAVPVQRPATEAVKAQKPAPAPVPQIAADDDDPEKLLKQYSDRQKTKISRLEQQLVDYRKVIAQRDDYKSKGEALAKELGSARKQVDAASKSDEVIKDLQSRVDAAILSNTMLTDENGKLKKSVQELQAGLKKLEEKATTADRASVEAQKALGVQKEARRAIEARMAAALQALQGDGAPRKVAPPVPPARK